MAGFVRFVRRMAGDPLEIAIHALDTSNGNDTVAYRGLLRNALSARPVWELNDLVYDRIAGKVSKYNRLESLRDLYLTDYNLKEGTGRTLEGNMVDHVQLIYALVRVGVARIPVNIQGMRVLHHLVINRDDSTPDTIRFVENAIRLGVDVNELFQEKTVVDEVATEVEKIPGRHRMNYIEKEERLQELSEYLRSRGARRFSEITRTPEDILRIVDKPGLAAELYRMKFPRLSLNRERGAYVSLDTHVFGVDAACTVGYNVDTVPTLIVVRGMVYIYANIYRSGRVTDLEIRTSPRPVDVPVDVPIDVGAPVAPVAPIPLSVEEVERRIRAVALPDLRVQLRGIRDGTGTTLVEMPATYRPEDSDDVFIVNGVLRILVKNGLDRLTNGNTMDSAITLQSIPATRRRKATRRTNKRRSRRNNKRTPL
jgi:hypothetical protein